MTKKIVITGHTHGVTKQFMICFAIKAVMKL